MFANGLIVVGFALARYMCARIMQPVERTSVRGGVIVSERKFAIVNLAVYKFEYCYAVPL